MKQVIFKNSTRVNHIHLGKNVLGKNDYRPSLTQVYLDLKEKQLVVTDAHVLMMYPVEIISDNTGEDGFLLPLQLFNTNKYVDNYKEYLLPIHYIVGEEDLKVMIGDIETPYDTAFRCRHCEPQRNGDKFPNYMNIIPKREEAGGVEKIGLNLSLLKRVADSMPDRKDVRFEFFAPNKGIFITENAVDDFRKPITGIIMPIMLGNG